MMRQIFWVPLGALLLALGILSRRSSPKKISRVGYLGAGQLPQTRLVWRRFGKVCSISATLRDRT